MNQEASAVYVASASGSSLRYLESAKADFVCVDAVSTAESYFLCLNYAKFLLHL